MNKDSWHVKRSAVQITLEEFEVVAQIVRDELGEMIQHEEKAIELVRISRQPIVVQDEYYKRTGEKP